MYISFNNKANNPHGLLHKKGWRVKGINPTAGAVSSHFGDKAQEDHWQSNTK